MLSKRYKIGYSCWGFLGKGIADTPDGGRSHRLVLLKELIKQGASIVMLQTNRDLLEGGKNFSNKNLNFNSKFPDIDALFLEYRFKIHGRNFGISKNNPKYTPDFDRQKELIGFYEKKSIPIIVWDKDQKLNKEESDKIKNSVIFEPALKPRFNRKSLLFPVDTQRVNQSIKNLEKYDCKKKIFNLVYIGNQYERDNDFKKFIDNPAAKLKTDTRVYGNWNKYKNQHKENIKKFPNVIFKGRLRFDKVNNVYKKSFCTVLIAPGRYYKTGHFTQRLFESLWGLCIPFAPDKYFGIEKVVIKDFIVKSGRDILVKINWLENETDNNIKNILKQQLLMLDIFNSEKQAKTIIDEINKYYGNNKKYIQKKYYNKERFLCELKHLKYFKKAGLRVPSIYNFDSKNKTINIERIGGKIKNNLTDSEIKKCIDEVYKIVTFCGLDKDNKNVNKYVSKVKSNILFWCKENRHKVNMKNLNSFLKELKRVCYISIFKDAKPNNWIFNQNGIYTIDFDYVKKSFFLADIAQLLSYIRLKRNFDLWKYVEYFLKKVFPKEKNYYKFNKPFMLAIVNSNVASKIHGKNFTHTTDVGFSKQNYTILKSLKII